MLKEIELKKVSLDPLKIIDQDWTLVTASKDNKVNTMTASRGAIGEIWFKPVSFIFIRQSRYTKEFLDAQDYYSLSFFDGKYKKEMAYLGSHSGRDEDKIKKVNGKISYFENVPYFSNASLVLICKKMYAQKMEEDCFFDKKAYEETYEKDYSDIHTMYIGEIVKVLKDEE